MEDDELKIIKVETMHRKDNIYIDVTVLDHGNERVETFIGNDWLEIDDKTKEAKFVGRILENKKILDTNGKVMSVDELKTKYVNKSFKVK